MEQDVIVVGQDFEVRCETELAGLGSYTNTIKYKRPDGVTGSLDATVSGTVLIAQVTSTINPVTGQPGKWSFYPNIISGSITYKGKTDHVIVSKEFQE